MKHLLRKILIDQIHFFFIEPGAEHRRFGIIPRTHYKPFPTTRTFGDDKSAIRPDGSLNIHDCIVIRTTAISSPPGCFKDGRLLLNPNVAHHCLSVCSRFKSHSSKGLLNDEHRQPLASKLI